MNGLTPNGRVELVPQRLPAAGIDPGDVLAGRESERHRGEEGRRRHLALPVERGGVADIGDAVADGIEHLEGRHHFARGVDRDVELPPDSARMRSAMRSADMPGPGRRFGHEVTMRHFCVCARAIAGAATRPAAMPVPIVKFRRVVIACSIVA